MSTQYIKLPNNSYAASKALRIKTIPHLSLLGNGNLSPENNVAMVEEYKNEMSNLLFQFYQYYTDNVRNGHSSNISLEILWITKPVDRQPYKARIELFVVARAIDTQMEHIDHMLDALLEFCTSSLSIQWFEYEKCSMDVLADEFEKVQKDKLRAVVKEERLDRLPFKNIQECYSFDIISRTKNDFHQLANTLINYPSCAVSFQFMPASYDNETKEVILQYSQLLSTIASGIQDQQFGNLSVQSAEKLSRLYFYYSEQCGRPLFSYNILVWGSQDAVTAIGSRTVGLLNSDFSRHVNMSFVDIPPQNVYVTKNYIHTIPWIANSIINKNHVRYNYVKEGRVSEALRCMPMIMSLEECAELFVLPFANTKIAAGFSVNETGRKSKTYADGIINGGDIILGNLKSSLNDKIGLQLKDLAKHMLVVGTPGSGKTTFSVGLLDRLWKEHGIPFLVIEPAKNEYRALIQSIPELQVFTPGKNNISPFVFNPFIPPKNVKLETYKSVLKTAFAAGVSMSSPLDKIFEESVNNCYSDFKWLDTYTIADKGEVFNISDFIKCFQETFEKIGYTGDAKNIGRAGTVRLKSLINLFDSYYSIPIEDILTKPTIIELAAIENNDQKALIIALILLSVLSYVNANYVGEGGLKNFILLEEAHVLLDSSSNGKENDANPAAIAQGLLKRMLAEIRSYGVGIAVADQSPRKVGIDIVALTDIKVAFRLVESQDKQILADSTSMNDAQVTRIAKLKPGETFLFFNKLEEPEEIITPDYRLDNKISISLSDEGIKELSSYWTSKQDKLRPYPECVKTPYCPHNCTLKRRMLAREIARRIFNKYINEGAKESDKVLFVFKNISQLISAELNGETFDRQLLSCIKVHLWRKIKYETKIAIPDATIEKSLIKE